MDELVFIGKTISTHGIKGELKVLSDFEYKDRSFKVNNEIMINNIMHTITSIRYHKNYILMGIDNKNNINDILKYVGFNIYIRKDDLNLQAGEFLLKDLIGLDVIDDKNYLGKVKEIVLGRHNNFIKVSGEKEFLIPFIDNYIVGVTEKEIKTKNAKDLML
jgi:16S rRNA processing protein RimM